MIFSVNCALFKLASTPTANLDVNGNARIRNVQAVVPDALFVKLI